MRHTLLALCLMTTGCVTSFDFVPVAQPELARAGSDLVSADRATVHTANGDEKVDPESTFKVDTPNGLHTGPWPLRETALECRSKTDCKLAQPGAYTVSKRHRRVDGDTVKSYLIATVVVGALSGLVAEHFVCFSDSTCQDAARVGLVVTDVALGVTTVALFGVVMLAAMKGLNN